MNKFNKSVVILLNSKKDIFVQSLLFYFQTADINTKIVTSRFELDLILLTHQLDHLIVSDQFKKNSPTKIENWAISKHQLKTTIFDEEKLIYELNLPAEKIEKTSVLKTLKIRVDNFRKESLFKNQLKDKFSKNIYQQLSLSNKRVEGNLKVAHIYNYHNKKEQRKNNMALLPISSYLKEIDSMNPEIISNLRSAFIGSKSGENESNLYAFSLELKDFNIIENGGKFEVHPEHCSNKVKNNFNIFIKLHSNEDYLYVINGKHLTDKKLNHLKSKNINIRVEPRNLKKIENLFTYFSHSK